MVLRMFVAVLMSCVASVAQADDTSITVDAPLVCMDQESAALLVRYYLEGGFDWVNAYVNEHSDQCFMMEKTPVPYEATKRLVVIESWRQFDYGYIPVSFWGVEFYLFFMKVTTTSIPA